MSDDSWTPNFGQLDASAPTWAPKRPVRIAVLGDFSAGAAAGRLETGSDLAARKLLPVEFDNLEDTMARLGVRLTLPIGDGGAGYGLTVNGVVSLNASNTYTGSTRVQSGTLRVNGSIPGSVEASAGTVGGSGTIGGDVAAGTVAPGDNGAGTLKINGNLTAGGATFELAGASNYDRVVVGAERHKLPNKELALLRRLASTPDQVVTHDELTAAAWGAERLGSNALEVHVSRLRRWLTRTLGQGVLEIRAVRRAGYLLTTKQPSSSAPS